MAEHTSARAALDLNQLGLKDVRVLLGGYTGWTMTGSPIVTGTEPR